MTDLLEKRLTLVDLARAFGVERESFRRMVGERFHPDLFHYRPLAPVERDRVILEILRGLCDDALPDPSLDPCRAALERFAGSGYALEALEPVNRQPRAILRLDGEFVEASSPRMETAFRALLWEWLVRQWLPGFAHYFQFGSGSGFHLPTLARRFPAATIHGLDKSPAAVEIVNLLAKKHGFPTQGLPFDLAAPDPGLHLPPKSAVITFFGLEEFGNRFSTFLAFLLARRPALCVHVEPIVEFYDPDHLVDWLALGFHRKRGLLTGFLPTLRELAAQNLVKILEKRRLRFGNLCHEGYSLLIWRPLGGEAA